MHIAWGDLQTIEALVRTGTVLEAARELSVRHSTVSRRIDAAERALGAPLFVRGARLEPTPLARTIALRATAMAVQARAVEAVVQQEERARARRLVVTTNDVLAPILFRAVAAASPEHRVQVLVSDTERELEPGVTDFALRPGGEPREALRGRRLGRLRVGIFTSRARGAERAKWVLPSPSLRGRTSMRWWKTVPVDAEGRVECDSLLAVRDACVAGLGRAVLPVFLAVDDARLHLEEEVLGGSPVWLLSPGTRRSDPALRKIGDRLAAALREQPRTWED